MGAARSIPRPRVSEPLPEIGTRVMTALARLLSSHTPSHGPPPMFVRLPGARGVGAPAVFAAGPGAGPQR